MPSLRAQGLELGQAVSEGGYPHDASSQKMVSSVSTWPVSPWRLPASMPSLKHPPGACIRLWRTGAGQCQPAGPGETQGLENSAGMVTMGPASHIPDAFEM